MLPLVAMFTVGVGGSLVLYNQRENYAQDEKSRGKSSGKLRELRHETVYWLRLIW